MSEQPNKEPFDDANLDSAEYRERLMRKLNCLIALLEVALARVRKSLTSTDPDTDRLTRIRTNLQSTLDVCVRARTALERREALPSDLPATLADVSKQARLDKQDKLRKAKDVLRPRPRTLPAGAHVEMSSREEQRRFETMGKINKQEMDAVDFEDLARKLQGL